MPTACCKQSGARKWGPSFPEVRSGRHCFNLVDMDGGLSWSFSMQAGFRAWSRPCKSAGPTPVWRRPSIRGREGCGGRGRRTCRARRWPASGNLGRGASHRRPGPGRGPRPHGRGHAGGRCPQVVPPPYAPIRTRWSASSRSCAGPQGTRRSGSAGQAGRAGADPEGLAGRAGAGVATVRLGLDPEGPNQAACRHSSNPDMMDCISPPALCPRPRQRGPG